MHLPHHQWCPRLPINSSALASGDPRLSYIWVCIINNILTKRKFTINRRFLSAGPYCNHVPSTFCGNVVAVVVCSKMLPNMKSPFLNLDSLLQQRLPTACPFNLSTTKTAEGSSTYISRYKMRCKQWNRNLGNIHSINRLCTPISQHSPSMQVAKC